MQIIKFFITPVYPYGNDHYYHEMIAIAEGFEELGYKIIGNCNYWFIKEKNKFLIQEDINNNDFEIAIYDYRYVTSFNHLLFRKGYPNFDKTKKHILIDRNDWIQPIWWNNDNYKIFDLIFAGNLYSNVTYPSNIKPWAIGLTNRMINAIDKNYSPSIKREKAVGYNFRINHNMRGYLLQNILKNLKSIPVVEKFTSPNFKNEVDSYYNKITHGRHNPDYYKQLTEINFFLSFGGYYEFKPFRYLPYNLIDKLLRKRYYLLYKLYKKRGKDFSNLVFIFQQDNFRFWEVLFSGAIAINIDLKKWNFILPEMPLSGIHYIGLNKLQNNNINDLLLKLNLEDIQKISTSGRNFALEHYSPIAQAKRILFTIENR
jgi:hypothetical protein